MRGGQHDVRRRRSGLFSALAAGAIAIGCGGDPGPTTVTPPPSPEPVPTALEIRDLPDGPLAVGATAQLTAQVTFSDGTSGQAHPVWSSAAPQVAEIDSEGLVTARSSGVARITAAIDAVRAEADITVGTDILYAVSGRVLNPNTQPVSGVRIVALDGPSAGAATESREDGAFRLAGLIGETTIAAQKTGYAELTRTVTGPDDSLDFRLGEAELRNSFGEGQWLVGDEIVPGRYFTDPAADCSWQRRSGVALAVGARRAAVSEPDRTLIAEGYHGADVAQEIVDIEPTDGVFRSTAECGVWEITPAQGPPAEVGPGAWLVGEQVTPGTWQATAGESCYWARLSGFGGTPADILEDAFLEQDARITVTIQQSDAGFRSTANCGVWTRLPRLSE